MNYYKSSKDVRRKSNQARLRLFLGRKSSAVREEREVDKFIFHLEALTEYQDAFAWYETRSIEAADRFEYVIEETLKLIVTSPDLFPVCGKNHRMAILPRFPYKIIFRKRPENTLIVAVAHSKRHSDYWTHRS